MSVEMAKRKTLEQPRKPKNVRSLKYTPYLTQNSKFSLTSEVWREFFVT